GRHLSSPRRLCRPYSTGREAGRSSGAVPDEIRDGREPQDCQGARPYSAVVNSAARRRGDRIEISQRKTIGPPASAMGQTRTRRFRSGSDSDPPSTSAAGLAHDRCASVSGPDLFHADISALIRAPYGSEAERGCSTRYGCAERRDKDGG